MRSSWKGVNAGLALSVVLLSLVPVASAEPKDDVTVRHWRGWSTAGPFH
jgi:hypothetical protein